MNYARKGSLKKILPEIIKQKWIIKLLRLLSIINGLNEIHQQHLIHCDFHHGNILNTTQRILSISDLGLCKPVEYFQSTSKKCNIYGILPFVAPEVLRGNSYTFASDIYSFSMIMWELTSGVIPFYHDTHDFQLALNICKGQRPKIDKNIPQSYIDLMTSCWDVDPLKRPNASKICKIIKHWIQPLMLNIFYQNYDAREVLSRNQMPIGARMKYHLTGFP
ncbi:9570_t:CDS:2 [Funneliformis geosporum]|nr:9570_t:CDS:2 [Funneliformis geosporum]